MGTKNSSISSVLGTLRIAFFGSPKAPLTLPALQGAVNAKAVRKAAGVVRLSELGVREVKQITLQDLQCNQQFTKLIRQAITNRQLLWVLEVTNPAKLHSICADFIDTMIPLNSEHTIWGIRVQTLVAKLLRTDKNFRTQLAGVDVTSTPLKIRRLLHQYHVKVAHSSLLTRLLHDPRTWVYLVTFIYSTLRALPAMWVPHFHGNFALLWAIDVISAIPYAWGILAIFTARKLSTRLIGGVVAIVTFVAPYLYFWAYGKDYPAPVIIAITLMISAGIGAELLRVQQERRLTALYESAQTLG